MNKYLEQIDDKANNRTEALLLEESQKLRHTNTLLEDQVKAHTSALKQSYEQLEKEVAERINTEKKLQRRITFDHILKTISRNFINLTIHDIDAGINEALIDVAAFNEFDRAYIYMLKENGRSLKYTHGWQKEDYPADVQDFSNLPVNLFQNWLPRLQTQETLIIKNVAEPDEETSSERKLLALQRAKSALIMPLVFGHETIGFLGLDSSNPSFTWEEETIDVIKMVGPIIVNALMRKKAEEDLIEKHNFAQQIMSTMGQGLFVTTVEGTFEYINLAYAEMLGYEPKDLIGKTALALTYQEDHTKLIQAQMQNLEGVVTTYEARLNRTDGSLIYVLVNSVPNRDRQGRIIGTISTVTDLTERRNIEAKIEANADELKLIYNATVQLFKPSSVQELAEKIASITIDDLGFDACGVLLLRKPLTLPTDRINLQTAERDNYLAWLARIGRFYSHKEEKIFLKEDGLVATAVRQGQIIYVPDVSQDTRYVPDNTYTQSKMVIPLRACNKIIGAIDLQSPHKNAFGEHTRRLVTMFAENAGLALETVRRYDQLQHQNKELKQQINDRNRIEQALRVRSNELNATNGKLAKVLRAKDEFLANMSHELRTPLNAILGKSEILLEGIHGELTEKQASSIQVIEDSGTHLLKLINDILDIAKIEAGKTQLDIQKVSLVDVTETSLHFVRQMAQKKQIKLQADIDRLLKTCEADERRLKQILINLLSNAIKFTPAGGEVGLNVLSVPEQDVVQFQVWDTGVGISPEEMEQLFRPFVQLDSSLARSHEGTGLGLSLVYRLTKMHGGGIALESQEGVGSCFTVSLPLNPKTDSALLQKQSKKDIHQFSSMPLNKYLPGQEPLILLVADHETIIEAALDCLPILGYRLKVIYSGNEVLKETYKELPALILWDIQISEVDGLTAVCQLRNEKELSNTPIIALTALAMQGDRDRYLEAGANEYLSKPIQLRQLVLTIEKLLTKQASQTKEPCHE